MDCQGGRRLSTANREHRADPPNFDAVCFHAQQCIEKLIKALLIQTGTIPPKTHDLNILAGLTAQRFPEQDWPMEELRLLSQAAVTFRYPGDSAGKIEAESALNACMDLRSIIHKLFEAK